MRNKLGGGAPVVLGLVLAFVTPAVAQEQFEGMIERFAPFPGVSVRLPIAIRIQSYTTAEEARELLKLPKQHEAQALRERLLDLDRARFQVNRQTSINLGLVRSVPTDDGWRLVQLVAGRPILITIAGARSNPSGVTVNDSVGIIELRLDHNGRGTGVLFPAARILSDKEGSLDIENLLPPFQITSVEAR